MSNLFPNLFSPFQIRGKQFKNRLFLPAHGTGYAEGGGIGDQGYAYYKARVENGISLLVSEASQVVSIEGQKYAQLSFATDDCIPRVQRLAQLCNEHDCHYFAQLYHEGRARSHSRDGSRDVAVAPSALPDERFHVMPRAMTKIMIEDLVVAFSNAANRAYQSGATGVELLVGMGYLHAQFLSPRTNIRTDLYGGSLANRARFLAETLVGMRDATDNDFIIGVRIAGEEYDLDGLTLEDTLGVCTLLDHDCLVDYINVCAAGTHSLIGATNIVPSMFVEPCPTLPYAEKIRKAVSCPIMTAGRINQPHQAEYAIKTGQSDMVGMVRALIADPEFAVKARDDRPDDIRACIACNQACIGHRHSGHGISCIQYPETGRELQYGKRSIVDLSKDVIVIGGGPGGMKAAAVAAERGHTVTLLERSSHLGGQVLLAQALPGRSEFGGLVTNLETEIRRFGVEVKMNISVTPEMILSQSVDEIIVATGASPYIPPGDFQEAHVVTAWDVIKNKSNVGSSVVIADWRCDWIGMGLAEQLAIEGCHVRLCVNGEMAGQNIQSYVRYLWTGKLHRLGVEIIPYMRLYGADKDTVYLQHVITQEAVLVGPVETLVLAYGNQAEVSLYDSLSPEISNLYAIGDCLSPRTAEEAILEGLTVGSNI